MKKILASVTLAGALVLTMAGCDDRPDEGSKCTTGSYWSHSENGKRTEMRCINGRWRKA